jgi:tol-pal system protein YbgF
MPMQGLDRLNKTRTASGMARKPAWLLAAGLLLLPPTLARAQDTNTVVAQQEVRIQQLEQQISDLTGKLEDATYQIQQLNSRIDRMQKDTELRLSTLEHGSGSMAAAAGAGTGAPAPAGAPSAPDQTAGAGTPPPQAAGTGILGRLSQGQMEAAQNAPAPAPATAPAANQTAAATPYDLPGATPQQQYEYAFGLLRAANYPEAEKAFTAFVQKNPNDVLAGNAQYWLGETYYVRGDYQKAAVTFAEGFQKYPSSGKAADNLLKLGMSLGEMGKKQDACTALTQLISKYPGAPEDLLVRARREKEHYGCA